MKKTTLIITTLLLSVLTLFTGGFIGWHLATENTIKTDVLQQRVFNEYGEGDAGLEMLNYLQTGEFLDFMGNPYDTNYVYIAEFKEDTTIEYLKCPKVNYGINPQEYQIRVEEDGNYIYKANKCIGFLPYDDKSKLDALILNDNL